MARQPLPRHPLDGLLNLDKPVGLTSARALDRVRALTGQRKSGHAGTLDPGASGVLLICLGRATRLVERLMDLPKVYRTTARLDVTSDSLDADSELLPVDVSAVPDPASVARALTDWTGLIRQTPPRISAVKIGGVPAYKRARRGEQVELQPRSVRVYWIRLHAYAWPVLDVEVCCGRGTYIRSLVRDIGRTLGTGGCLTALARTRVGPFAQTEAWSLEALGGITDIQKVVVDLEAAKALLDQPSVAFPPSSPDARCSRDTEPSPVHRA